MPLSCVWLAALLACWHPAARLERDGFLSKEREVLMTSTGGPDLSRSNPELSTSFAERTGAHEQFEAAPRVFDIYTSLHASAVGPVRSDALSWCAPTAADPALDDMIYSMSLRAPFEDCTPDSS